MTQTFGWGMIFFSFTRPWMRNRIQSNKKIQQNNKNCKRIIKKDHKLKVYQSCQGLYLLLRNINTISIIINKQQTKWMLFSKSEKKENIFYNGETPIMGNSKHYYCINVRVMWNLYDQQHLLKM